MRLVVLSLPPFSFSAFPSVSPPLPSHPGLATRAEIIQDLVALGLKRYQIASAFGRDLRRVRASVIGTTPRHPNRMEVSY